jgi:hypothetical protein
MPYVSQEREEELKPFVEALSKQVSTAGDMNHVFSVLLLKTNPVCYDDYNRLIGILECAKLEFYHRAVRVYEDRKIAENGDIYRRYPVGSIVAPKRMMESH